MWYDKGMNMRKGIIFISVMAGFFAFAGFAVAQSYTPLAPLPIGDGGTLSTSYTINGYLSGMLKLIIALGGALSILMAIVGGTQYVASGVSPDAKNGAKERVQNALTGLALILTSYLILNSINPQLVQFNFMLPPVGVAPGTTINPATSGSVAGINSVVSGGATSPVGNGNILSSLYKNSNTAVLPSTTTTQNPVINSLTSSGGARGTSVGVGTNNVAPRNVSGLTNAQMAAQSQAQAQAAINARIDRTNDYSIISHCVGNTTYDLCPKTDLNGDGKTDVADLTIFMTKGNILDVNQNKTVEITDTVPPSARSCFFKTTTANIQNMLPQEKKVDDVLAEVCAGSTVGLGFLGTTLTPTVLFTVGLGVPGTTLAPTVVCNGSTWLNFSTVGGSCAADSGFLPLPFGFVYGANGTSPGAGGSDGQYSNFKIWIQSVISGTGVNLATLFVKTFLNNPQPACYGDNSCAVHDPYLESNLGKITYATIAQYDLNNDGTADFNLGGADMTVFNGCRGASLWGTCAQADFNGDGVVDDRDLGFVTFMQRDILGNSGFIPLGWKLEWFESMMFDPTGNNDKQIINYCMGRTAFEKCGFADVNSDNVVNTADLTEFNATSRLLDFNGDGKVDLR